MAKKEANPQKIAIVKRLAERIKDSPTIMVVGIKSLPSRQFQAIKKKLRGKMDIELVKKSLLVRALDVVGGEVDKLREHVLADCAIGFSNQDAFEIAAILSSEKNPVSAKAGQEAPEDLTIEAGGTELLPGPAISELGAVGLKVGVEDGKIAIKETKVVAKKGEVINDNLAAVLQKLDIKPFLIGLEATAIYDAKSGKIYLDVKIDKEAAVENLMDCSGRALGLAQKIAYYCKETIGYLLAKANANAGALEKLAPAEVKAEEKPVEGEEKKEEAKPEEASEEKPAEEVKTEENQTDNKSEEENK